MTVGRRTGTRTITRALGQVVGQGEGEGGHAAVMESGVQGGCTPALVPSWGGFPAAAIPPFLHMCAACGVQCKYLSLALPLPPLQSPGAKVECRVACWRSPACARRLITSANPSCSSMAQCTPPPAHPDQRRTRCAVGESVH